MSEEGILRLVRRELLEVFEEADKRSRQGSSAAGFGTSEIDMSAGRGTPTEYLAEVVRKRIGEAVEMQTEETKEFPKP
jgi:hypothetical protein